MLDQLESQITFLNTLDLETTHAFYAGVLGLPLVLDQGKCRIYQTATGAYLGFCLREGGVVAEGVVITLVTPNVDGWYERLRQRGIVFESPPASHEAYQIYHCFLRDPNGYRVEIQRFDDPRWS